MKDTINPSCCFTNFDNCCCTTVDKSRDKPIFMESTNYPVDNMIYKNEGNNAIVKILSHKLDKDGMLTYQIEYPSGELKEIPREFLSHPNNPDVAA